VSKVDTELLERFEREIRRDGRYVADAFEFVHSGLQAATRIKHGDAGKRCHVSGAELCQSLRILALQRWGRLAREVLARWNILATRDFGEMVYLMIDLGLMGRQDSDSIADFDDVYDFRSAFDAYRPLLELKS
jgi:uncharacterized repeat protein (TIGR04138 family)